MQGLCTGDDAPALTGELEPSREQLLGLVEALLVAVRLGQVIERVCIEVLAVVLMGEFQRLLGNALLGGEVAHPPGDARPYAESRETPVRRQRIQRRIDQLGRLRQ